MWSINCATCFVDHGVLYQLVPSTILNDSLHTHTALCTFPCGRLGEHPNRPPVPGVLHRILHEASKSLLCPLDDCLSAADEECSPELYLGRAQVGSRVRKPGIRRDNPTFDSLP